MDRTQPAKVARATLKRAVQRGGRALGYDVIRHHFYSPLPDIENLRPGLWPGPQPAPGVNLRVAAAVALLDELRPALDEWHPPLVSSGVAGGYFVTNGSFESVDAEILYAMVRRYKPATIIELGSGASSHVIHQARLVNATEGHETRHRIYDPYPFQASGLGPVDASVVHPVLAQDISNDAVSVLGDGDILFVDTTHTVKTGGDVTRILLDLVPGLARGVLIHLHDIFLPYEYPRHWVVEDRRAWAEQYLLQAFLAFNEHFEVVFPAHAVARAHPDALRAAIPSFAAGRFAPGSFWMRRVT